MADPTPSYDALRDQIEQLLSEGKVSSHRSSQWEKVETYWHIGDTLDSHVRGQPRADHGEHVIVNLSKDLNLSQSLLWEILRFRRALPILYTCRVLGWSHIRQVLRLPSQDQRLFYLRSANQARWTVRQLRQAIQADHWGHTTSAPLAVPEDQDPAPSTPLQPRLGNLYTYKVQPHPLHPTQRRYLDLGFHIFWAPPVPDLQDCAFGDIVTIPPGADTHTRRRAGTRLWTHVAEVQRVIDGDSLLSIVDPGFDHFLPDQRLRLNGIDCPELYTLAGRTARDFVADTLGQVDFIVVTTFRTDSYGRYLADVLYLPGESDPLAVRQKGTYLNRQLLDLRLARRYVRS